MMKQRLGQIIKVYRAEDTISQAYHFHNGYEMIFIETGCAEFTINGIVHQYKPNDIIFFNQMDKHQMKPLSHEYEIGRAHV